VVDGSLGKRRKRPVWGRTRARREFEHGRHSEKELVVV
jgi:hypothetical protein